MNNVLLYYFSSLSTTDDVNQGESRRGLEGMKLMQVIHPLLKKTNLKKVI